MEAEHIQYIKEWVESNKVTSIGYRYNTLVDITTRFFAEENEELKNDVRDKLTERCKSLISDLNILAKNMEARLRYIVED